MCGIGGFIDWADCLSSDEKTHALNMMQKAMAHRGPDAQGSYISKNGRIGLVHTRLSIVDLTATGSQPMHQKEMGTSIVFNGEIYNHCELREILLKEGVQFVGTSDTEVLLNWLSLYGVDKLNEVDGMFAFCFRDEKRHKIILARDPIGEKPLYYLQHGTQLVAFASETRALLESQLSQGRICSKGMYYLLRQGTIPPPYTHIEDIRLLKPGCFLEIDTRAATVKEISYWRHPYQSDVAFAHMSEEEAAHRLETAIQNSFKRRLRADVPVGAFLSGGIDSTYVCARLFEAGAPELNTFTVVMPDKPGDESVFAREISKRLGTKHHEIPIDLSEDKDWLQLALDDMDVPSIDGPNTWLVSRAVAKEGFKVACSGVGGDELFYGYPSFSLADKMHWATQVLSTPLLSYLGKIFVPVLTPLISNPKGYRMLESVERGMSVASLWLAKRAIFSEKEIGEFLSDIIFSQVESENNYQRIQSVLGAAQAEPLREVSALEQQVYMHDQLLRDTDVMSMAHSLEVRLPMISKEIVETVALLSPRWIWKKGPKWILKDWLAQKGFDGFFDRPKQGFTLNWSEILKSHFKKGNLDWDSTVFNVEKIKDEKALFLRGRRQYARIFSLMSVQNKINSSTCTPQIAHK